MKTTESLRELDDLTNWRFRKRGAESETQNADSRSGEARMSDEDIERYFRLKRQEGFRFYKELLEAPEAPEPRWRIEGVIPKGITLLVGGPGLGKSLLVLGWGHHVATGAPWFGRHVDRGCFVYLCPELNLIDFRERLWACHAEFDSEPDEKSFAVRLQDQRPFCLNADASVEEESDVERLINFIRSHSDGNGLFVIDTLAEHFSGEENSGSDMGAFVRSLRQIRAACPKMDMIVVHHPTKKGTDERGHTTLRGSVDLILKLGKDLTLTTEKARGAPVVPIKLKIETVNLHQAFPDQFPAADAYDSVVMRVAEKRESEPGVVQALKVLAEHPDGLTMTDWSRECGIPQTSLKRKAEKHWSVSVERRSDGKYVLTAKGSQWLALAK